jgi:alkyl hydroperoxide reductase subunit AhpC
MRLSATGNFEKNQVGSLCFEDGDFTFVFTPDEAVVMAELLDAFFDERQRALK